MALCLYRLARTTGIDVSNTADAGFTDLDGLSPDARTAVNALHNVGIVSGTSTTTFSSNTKVSRQQVAAFLQRADLRLSGASTAAPDYFTDDDGRAAESSINKLAELGIAGGVTPTTIAPMADLSRQQMAAFLAHFLERQIVDLGRH